MAANPPEGMPRITAALFYDDPAAALAWLAEAFGFQTRVSIPGPDGGVAHAEMCLDDGVIMVGPAAAEGPYRSPRSLDGGVTQSLYVYVDDVDAHFARARDAGARIISPPEEKFYGDRMYEAHDLEGHRWVFAQHVRDVAPEDLEPPD